MDKKHNTSKKFTVKEDCLLLDFLVSCFPEKSKKSLRNLLQYSCISLDGKILKRADYPLKANQQIELATEKNYTINNVFGIPIIYEDDDILVIDKPNGLLAIGTEKEKNNTAYSMLSNYVKTKSLKNKVFIVHRLDRDTSGIMVFAKNIKARDILQNNWHGETHYREYVALVSGKVEDESGIIESWLKENGNLQIYSSYRAGEGQHAITEYYITKQNEDFTLLKIVPQTGRRNQIRVHLSDIGHPIVGDRRYGNKINPIGYLGLFANILVIEHPITHKSLRFELPIPNAFMHVFKAKSR